MASGIDWFRWHHGSVTDPKFQLVAKKSGASVAEVVAVWAFMLEVGSENGAAISSFSPSMCDESLQLHPGLAGRIYAEMAGRGLVLGDRIANPRRYFPAPSMRPSGGLWAAIRSIIFERDDYTCRYCGARGGRLECDHVIPVADGGLHTANNLVTACFCCNRSKAAMPLAEWEVLRGW